MKKKSIGPQGKKEKFVYRNASQTASTSVCSVASCRTIAARRLNSISAPHLTVDNLRQSIHAF